MVSPKPRFTGRAVTFDGIKSPLALFRKARFEGKTASSRGLGGVQHPGFFRAPGRAAAVICPACPGRQRPSGIAGRRGCYGAVSLIVATLEWNRADRVRTHPCTSYTPGSGTPDHQRRGKVALSPG